MHKILLPWFVKGKGMNPFEIWKAILSKDILDLQRLQAQDDFTRTRRLLKEQELAQHCCQAGENLDNADLSRLKEALGLDEQQWHASKSNLRPAQE
jgi:hypothetical protein